MHEQLLEALCLRGKQVLNQCLQIGLLGIHTCVHCLDLAFNMLDASSDLAPDLGHLGSNALLKPLGNLVNLRQASLHLALDLGNLTCDLGMDGIINTLPHVGFAGP